MSKQIPHEIIDRASEWLIEMRETDISDTKREAFAEWLGSSPAHVQAYLEVAGIWGDASQVSKEFTVALAHAATNVVALDKGDFASAFLSLGVQEREEEEGKGKVAREGDSLFPLRGSAAEGEGSRAHESLQERDSPHTPESPGPGTALARAAAAAAAKRAPTRAHLAIAATLLLAMGAGIATWWQSTRPPTYTADVGEQRVITLDDGSIIRLNSRSEVRVRLTPQHRNIELLAGQAHFQVAKDHTRPFIVRSGDVAVRAVGTQFDVYRRKTGTTVTVVEGRVAVTGTSSASGTFSSNAEKNQESNSSSGSAHAPNRNSSRSGSDAGSAPSAGEKNRSSLSPLRARGEEGALWEGEVLLAAGEQITVTPTALPHPQKANIAAATGWLQQELIFTGEPLSVVIDEFNRYTRRTIVLDDPTLAQLKINAAFNTTNPQSLLLFLNRMEGVRVNETETAIHIDRREPHN